MTPDGTGVKSVQSDSSAGTYKGSCFRDVRAQLLSDPYTVLPHHQVSIGSMFKAAKNILLTDSYSLVDRDADLVPYMQKLLHAVGICMFGRWTITEDTGYTGCFRGGTDHLIVIRCSTLLSATDRGMRRGFGLAGKIFPTLDPNEVVKTANFVTIDVLGGTFAKRFSDVKLTNTPAFGLNFGLLKLAFVMLNIIYVFNRADNAPDYRPLYALSETGLRPGETPKGPKWLQLAVEEGIGKSDAIDFRDELRVAKYKDGKLRFAISVADEKSPQGQQLWRRVGTLELTEDVCSESGDHRIRFRHQPNRGHAAPPK